MADLSQPNNPSYNPDDHLARLLAAERSPWYKSLIQNIKETINPPKLPPLEVTSKPVAVKDIWGLYGHQKKSFMMSTGVPDAVVVSAVHGVLLESRSRIRLSSPHLCGAGRSGASSGATPKKQTMGGGGGGGDRSPLPAGKGQAAQARAAAVHASDAGDPTRIPS